MQFRRGFLDTNLLKGAVVICLCLSFPCRGASLEVVTDVPITALQPESDAVPMAIGRADFGAHECDAVGSHQADHLLHVRFREDVAVVP